MPDSWKDLKEDLNPHGEITHKLEVKSTYRRFIVPFWMYQQHRDILEKWVKEAFLEDTGSEAKAIYAGSRLGPKNSDLLLRVAGFEKDWQMYVKSDDA